jgi:hypothetical protein
MPVARVEDGFRETHLRVMLVARGEDRHCGFWTILFTT